MLIGQFRKIVDPTPSRSFCIWFVLGLTAFVIPVIADEPQEPVITDADRDHWSFRPVVRSTVPQVKNVGWVRTLIDAFILSKLEQAGWQPNPSAERRDLLRRTHLDLTGLPPTLAEQDQFLADESPAAFERLIDNLLSRPTYGERWGRHWLDLARYAETNGYERDGAKPSVWRYRDYIINAFNTDKPYDRFILEQFAGDELEEASTETVIATGFHRLGPWDDEPADYEQDRWDQLDDIIRTTSQAFLGITLGCARCHNHKFDPFSAHDYYRLAAVLNPLKRPQAGRTELDLPAGTVAQRALLAKLQTARQRLDTLKATGPAEYVKSNRSRLPAEVLAAFATDPGQRNDRQRELVQQHQTDWDAEFGAWFQETHRVELSQLQQAIDRLRKEAPSLPTGYFMTEGSDPPPATFVLLRGQAASRGPEIRPGVPLVLVKQPPALDAGRTSHGTSGRRLNFARWMVSADNPLTARVIVNRVWQYHFGEGLVRTPSDFGIIGETPTHPELLDWLAHWFVHDANWSIKKLHRLILSSSTYQMSKADHPVYGEQDPRNVKLWRFPYRRLEVEAIRDSMLSVTGQLRRQMGGPGVYLEIPPEVLAGNSDPNVVWPKFDEAAASRRTVYAFVKRGLVVPFLEVLDVCDTTRSTELRSRTTIAPQALTLFNGDFATRQARYLAERLIREAGNDPKGQIELAYRLTLCRPPTANETATILRFLAEATDPEQRRASVEQLCRVILNLNEFVYSN